MMGGMGAGWRGPLAPLRGSVREGVARRCGAPGIGYNGVSRHCSISCSGYQGGQAVRTPGLLDCTTSGGYRLCIAYHIWWPVATKLKVRWDVHLWGVVNQVGRFEGALLPEIRGLSGTAVRPRTS